MEKFELGTVIAERELSLPDGHIVMVRLGAPQTFPGETSYFCPYEMTIWGRPALRRGAGVDAIQALQLTLQKIGVELYEINRLCGNALRWEGGDAGDVGFPLPQNVLDILDGPAAGQEAPMISTKKRRPKHPAKKAARKKK